MEMRLLIDQLLTDWRLTDGVRPSGTCARRARSQGTSFELSAGEAQGHRYADQFGVPFIFLSNDEEVWLRDRTHDAHLRCVDTLFTHDDLVCRMAASEVRRKPLDIEIDPDPTKKATARQRGLSTTRQVRIAGGGGRVHQTACIDVVRREIGVGRRTLLVEMAGNTDIYHP